MKYKVLSPLNHNNATYGIGYEIDLDQEVGDHLAEIGVVKALGVAEPSVTPNADTSTPAKVVADPPVTTSADTSTPAKAAKDKA